jgi:hypothetical protein
MNPLKFRAWHPKIGWLTDLVLYEDGSGHGRDKQGDEAGRLHGDASLRERLLPDEGHRQHPRESRTAKAMTPSAILQRLKEIRSTTHRTPILAVENALDRLIVAIESDQEVEKLWRGETLTTYGLEIRLERS